MADKTDGAPTMDMASMQAFAKMIADGVTAGISNSTRRKVTFGEYETRPTAYHPNKKSGPKLTRNYSQNGIRIRYENSSDDEVRLLERLTHGGRYIDRLVEVIFVQDGTEESIDIRYNNKTNDQKLQIGSAVQGSFKRMLELIVADQEAEDNDAALEEATRPEHGANRRPFGSGKATRDARAAAGV